MGIILTRSEENAGRRWEASHSHYFSPRSRPIDFMRLFEPTQASIPTALKPLCINHGQYLCLAHSRAHIHIRVLEQAVLFLFAHASFPPF